VLVSRLIVDPPTWYLGGHLSGRCAGRRYDVAVPRILDDDAPRTAHDEPDPAVEGTSPDIASSGPALALDGAAHSLTTMALRPPLGRRAW
jgi:GntP family gluconate:H+ symporter